MNISKTGSLRLLRRTARLRYEDTSAGFVSALIAASISASSAPTDKPDNEVLRRMAEELQQKINKRNLDYGIADIITDDTVPPSAAPQKRAASAVDEPHQPHAAIGLLLEMQVSWTDADDSNDRNNGNGKLIETDIAQWIIGPEQAFRTPHADRTGPDGARQGVAATARQLPL